MKFQIWSEGFNITGNSGRAIYEGESEGDNFYDACLNLLGNRLDKDKEGNYKLSIWGCALYGNETDARKSFG